MGERGPLETVYDEQLSSLVSQIIDICKANGVGLFMTACLDGDMQCTTLIPPQAVRAPCRTVGRTHTRSAHDDDDQS